MENEKKNVPASTTNKHNHSGHRRSKNRSQKSKSYFIDPSTQTPTDAQKVNTSATVENNKEIAKNYSSAEPGTQINKNQHKSSNHSRYRSHKKNSAIQEEKTHDTQSTQQKNDVAKTTQSEQNQQPKAASGKNHSKNRHHAEKGKQEKVIPKPTESPVDTNLADELQSSEIFSSFSKQSDKLQRPVPPKMPKFSDLPEFSQYSDYEEISYADFYGEDAPVLDGLSNSKKEKSDESDGEPRVEVVGIRFKASGKTYYFEPNGNSLKCGMHAIVETARGLEYGEVSIANTFVKESETVPPLRPVIRKATDADKKHHLENKEKEENAFRICNEKIIAHELDMKLIDAQYTFDNTKLLFYFTSSGRVDFRDLVKDLAAIFRTRIELRQIGIRDEAKMVGGLGLCGRPLCCSLFLTDFGQVSIKMAKEQNLSLNSSKISGICGRLMCCLRYEHDTYEYEIKRTPPVDSLVRTVDGVGTVTEINPLAATIKVKLTASPDTPPKSYKRDEVTLLQKKH